MPEKNNRPPKYVSPDSALGLYWLTRNPRFIWSFLFAFVTLFVAIFGAIYFIQNGLKSEEATKTLLKFIIAGAASMGLSRAFYGDIRGSIGILFACLATTFIYQFA